MERPLKQQAMISHKFAVIIGKHNQGILFQPLLPQCLKNTADIVIYQTDHPIISGFHLAPFMIAQTAVIVFFIAAASALAVAAEMRRLILQLPFSAHRQGKPVRIIHRRIRRRRIEGMMRVHKTAQSEKTAGSDRLRESDRSSDPQSRPTDDTPD